MITGERTVLQKSFSYSFNLNGRVPMDHLLRSVDRLSISPASASTCNPTTARSAGPMSGPVYRAVG